MASISVPSVINPVYHPIPLNVISSNVNYPNFKFLHYLSAQTTSIIDLGVYRKEATYNNNNNWFDPSRVLQTVFSAGTLPAQIYNETKVFGDGDKSVAYVSSKIVDGTGSTLNINYYVFNGSIDRRRSIWDTNKLNEFDWIPTSASTRAKLLTNFTTRKVYTDDRGTMSMLNGTFNITGTGLTADNKYIDIKTYNKWDFLEKNYHIYNHLWSDSGTTPTTNKRVTVPFYPTNLNESIAFEFYDNDFSPSGLAGGKVGFRFTNAIPDNIKVGDSIQVYQYPTYTNASYNGLTTITWISDNRLALETAKGWGVSTPAEPGLIYAVNRHSVFSGNTTPLYISGTSSTAGILTLHFDTSNGFDANSIPYGAQCFTHGFASSNYNLTFTATTALTSYQMVVPTIPFISNQTGYTTCPSRLVKGPVIGDDTYKYKMKMVTTPYYKFVSASAITAITMTEFGQLYTLNVDHNCDYNDTLPIAYQNALGAYETLSLRGRRDTTTNINRESYEKTLGFGDTSLGGGGFWNYYNTDFQYNNFNSSSYETYSYWTGYLDENGSGMVQELLRSNNIYVYLNSEWVPIVITNTEEVYQNNKNEGLINYKLEFRCTYNKNGIRN